jgi:hypothetical protein
VLAAVRSVCGYSNKQDDYSTPSLAVQLGNGIICSGTVRFVERSSHSPTADDAQCAEKSTFSAAVGVQNNIVRVAESRYVNKLVRSTAAGVQNDTGRIEAPSY